MQSCIKDDYANKIKSMYKKALDLTILLYEDNLSNDSCINFVDELHNTLNIWF